MLKQEKYIKIKADKNNYRLFCLYQIYIITFVEHLAVKLYRIRAVMLN